MVLTPWGDMDELGARRLPPGPTATPEAVARSQRERLYAAMVTATAERGYQDTTVADLVRLSGVSRRSFYTHFDDKADCFRATIEEVLGLAVSLIAHRLERAEEPWEERARGALQAFMNLVVAQPAASRLCLVESYAAGEAGMEPVQGAWEQLGALARHALDRIPGHADLGPELSRAVAGGIHRVLYRRLHQHREVELPELVAPLWDWAMGYSAPPQPLRPRGRQARPGAHTTPLSAYDSEQRIIRAFAAVAAEKGYAATTVAAVAAAGSISQATIYSHFDDKREILMAALDSSGAQLSAAMLPAVRRAGSLPEAVRVGLGAMCGFLALEPDFARLRQVEVYAAGPEAILRRDQAGDELIEALFSPAFNGGPEVDPTAAEAIFGAVSAALYEQIRDNGPASAPEVAPLLTYIVLAPFLGAEKASEVATESGRRRART